MSSKSKVTLSLIAAGAMAAALSTANADTMEMEEGASDDAAAMEHCFGVAKAGKNDCRSSIPGSTCQGTSTFDSDPNAYINVPAGTCDKIVGGSTEPADA